MYKVRVRGTEQRSAAVTITIKDAAAILGVCEMTLRRWDKSGKFKAKRHPLNNFRMYPRDQVVKLRKLIEDGKAT